MHFLIFFKQALLFGGVQALALLAAWRIKAAPGATPIQPLPVASIWEMLLILGAAILLIFLLMRLQSGKSSTAVRIFWLFALFGGVLMLLKTFMGEEIALPLSILLIFIYAKAATINFHNCILVLGLAGIGATLGTQIAPREVILLLVLLSIYDIIAVYGTRHMTKMAESFISSGVVPGIIVAESSSHQGATWVNEVGAGKDLTILGTGDLALPAILAASALQFIHPAAGIAAALGAVAGLFLMNRIFFGQKERRPMPALPPIALGAITGFLIAAQFLV